MKSILRPLAVALALAAAWPAAAEPYLDELIVRSRSLRLAERREWHRLLHYIGNLLRPGVHSLADAPEFFLAPDGKRNPQAELEATLAAFFAEVEETDRIQHPQCRFIARFAWLERELGFDDRLHRRPCTRFEAWRAAIDPAGVTLVFPSAYINNPSSMYGHTLLRIDARGQDERTRLLSYAINYTANTDETNGFLFAMNALYGVYPGMFSIMPYYLKVREYNDLENRDIWEYELNLTPAEIDRMLMHAWELGEVHFDYYFFDENCSYYLLELLETARPDLDLTTQFRWWAIPTDTVRAVVQQQGLLRRVVYRPSNATVVQHRLQRMSHSERVAALGLAMGTLAASDESMVGLRPERRAGVLEVGYDYLSYLRAAGDVAPDAAGPRATALLQARSGVTAQADYEAVPVPDVRPDQGHRTARIALGAGRRDGIDFMELRMRPSYHDLLDHEPGYAQGAQIQFMDFGVRYYGEDVGLRLEDFRPVDIFSVSPRNAFFRPLSWRVDGGWTRKRLADGSEPLVAGLHGGAGWAWRFPDPYGSRNLAYVFIEATTQFHGRLDHNYAFGLGPNAGVFVDFGTRLRTELFARTQAFVAGENAAEWQAGIRQRYTLTTDSALRLEFSREGQEDQRWNTGTLSLHLYF